MQATRTRFESENFITSEVFAKTFKQGMALVEETANYLDGDGRDASKGLSRDASLAYAGASMRLTTRLMQIASWLLVLRAVREGDMSLEEASEGKYRLSSDEGEPSEPLNGELPQRLFTLIDASSSLYERIVRLDDELFGDRRDAQDEQGAAAQQRALMEAFASSN